MQASVWNICVKIWDENNSGQRESVTLKASLKGLICWT